jgi:hypothetical protein
MVSPVFVQCKVRIPMIGTWKWKQADFEVPLTFQLPGARAHLFLDASDSGKRERSVI